MKTLPIALSLILSLGLFGCHDKESALTPSSEAIDENSASRPSSETVDEESASTPSNETGSTPDPVRPELPSNDPDPDLLCRGVSSWDGVTEDSGNIFCSPEPTRPSSQEPIIDCTGIVTSQAQLDSVRDCTVLWGSLQFDSSAITVINLPLLEQITGEVFLVGNYRLTNLLLPALTSIGELFRAKFNSMTEISLPALKSVGGSVWITANRVLRHISLPVLTTMDGSLAISYSDALTEVSLPALTTIGRSLYITDDDALTEFSLPLLTTLGGYIKISYNDELTDFSIPALTSIEDSIENDSDYFFLNRYLTNCDLGSYTDQYCP